MTRRTFTLLASAVLVIGLAAVVFFMPVPYVVLSPGPTLNTLGADTEGKEIIMITGHDTNDTSGHLNLTTVEVESSNVTSARALYGWWRHDEVVVPRGAIFPPGQTQHQVEEQNAAEFTQSQNSAVAAAACELGYPSGLGVASVADGSGAEGHLKDYDRIVKIGSDTVDSFDGITAALEKYKPGDTVSVEVDRGGKHLTIPVVLGKPAKAGGTPRLGIQVTVGCIMPFKVDLGLGDDIGGPSAGLMFALGIMDKVGSDDLTHGAYIAGTGEIDSAGKVGPIGGIALKMIGARSAGATIFLAPADNCNDVVGNVPSGLQVVKVTTLHDAVTSLDAISKGKPAPHC